MLGMERCDELNTAEAWLIYSERHEGPRGDRWQFLKSLQMAGKEEMNGSNNHPS
jgi:hypothetical protein